MRQNPIRRRRKRTSSGSRSIATGRCRHLDGVQRRPRHEVKTGPRPSPGLRVPDPIAERDRRTDSPEGYAGNPGDGRRARCVDARTVGRGQSTATPTGGRCVEDRCARRGQGRPGHSGVNPRQLRLNYWTKGSPSTRRLASKLFWSIVLDLSIAILGRGVGTTPPFRWIAFQIGRGTISART
jgi:hypothetical protein